MRACPKKNSPAADMVMTPPELAERIVKHFKPSGCALDPCRGMGAFFFALEKSRCRMVDYCEEQEGRDFFSPSVASDFDWIITNPPWSKFVPFLLKAMEVSDNVVFLVTLNHFQTKARMRMIGEAGFRFKEIALVETPPEPWPQSGFQVAAVHIQRGWKGDCKFSKL